MCGRMKEKKVAFLAFINLEKAHDRMERQAMWQVLRIHGVVGQSSACVRVGGNVSVCSRVMAKLKTRVLDVPVAVHYFLGRLNERRDSQKYAKARFQHDQPKSERMAS